MDTRLEQLQKLAASLTSETSDVDFKSAFDPAGAGDWCEIVKDIVAMANTAGGVIIFGVENDGSDTESFVDHVSTLDPAMVTNKIFKYTTIHFGDFQVASVTRPSGTGRPALLVSPCLYPIVFTSPGTYSTEGTKQKVAFAQGTIYFRHGAKSEPASANDLRDAFDRLLNVTRSQWMDGIRKVVDSPPGHKVVVVSAGDGGGAGVVAPGRLTNESGAIPMNPEHLTEAYPYRVKEVVSEVKMRLGSGVHVTNYTVRAIRRAHGIDTNVAYSFQPPYGSRLFAKMFVDWIVECQRKDTAFLVEALKEMKKWEKDGREKKEK
jgi:hypothetical protein